MSDSHQDSNPAQQRPVFRNIGIAQLAQYRLPWPGKVSILHRISGAALFLFLPFILFLFDKSLASELSFAYFSNLLGNPFVKLICLGLIWGYLHHFCAGIRYLFLDLEIGVDKAAANRSAVSVMVISLTLTAILGLRLFGLF
ncbi:MAG: succinate dehydrogenase, cytochrome b556 subunit [Polynucleobacter sp.]|jgi:succinate dehydrogenase / fumarate reductase cytochrome b subunit|uniref:succinate dehydrogenase, cytochrome b556 subunit n=1 Tax=Polynucleobacter sp. MWH-UH24A TaxID=2689110 RepID=UPI001BFE5A07|nr:succinate dehydrogenase, cytochrome b556 subunit [Polynucleobacter sp. MWH-UH24A]MBU3725937.1 succinate dehydrogenase, cytochrome b556 subunit [Polynucleobacter sp.]MBU6322222.1 succinate dehydrogenase, cytochrome b556 subunit [Burkholderiales bacterium]NBO85464.1 succinate dehydrogenase, cytochrome b556 subunit [Burkholderiaceae bacterium]NBP19942.1 succinate dehydrogenase, cytochrome b556 subunit [Burkholderiaceae bacterium]NCA09996.1 succinate dehydrogenase, cytochrome b556 subunit [Burk